jgi:hypothetical protein
MTSLNEESETQALLRMGLGQTSRLAALRPPDGAARSTAVSLVALSREGTILIGRILSAEKRRDTAAITRLAATATKVNGRLNAVANRLGAHICAENPVQGG